MGHEAAAAYGWQSNENDGSQVNIVPTGGVLEVRELEMGFEDRGRNGKEKDEEYGWGASRAAMSATTVV